MATKEQVNRLNLYATTCGFGVPHAIVVVNFCTLESIPCRLTPDTLAAAMQQTAYWNQSLGAHLDFVLAFETAYTICEKRRIKANQEQLQLL